MEKMDEERADSTENEIENNDGGDNEAYKEWKHRRRIITYIAHIQAFLFGIEYTSISVSALYYFSEDFHTDDPNLFYGMSMAAVYGSAIFSNPIMGRLVDETRRLRIIILVALAFGVIGNFVYTISFSTPWLPVIGRFLAGIIDGCYPVMSGILKFQQYFFSIIFCFIFIFNWSNGFCRGGFRRSTNI